VKSEDGILGVVGLVSRSERDRRSLPEVVFAGEILVDRVPSRPRPAGFAAYSSFPPIEADLSFAHDRSLPWSELARFLSEQGLSGLEDFRVTDRWEGANVAKDRTKTTLRLTFRAADRTLSQEEVNRERDRLVEALKSRFGVDF
jgi:phenylalanyl-tRNA synthetase beta chain